MGWPRERRTAKVSELMISDVVGSCPHPSRAGQGEPSTTLLYPCASLKEDTFWLINHFANVTFRHPTRYMYSAPKKYSSKGLSATTQRWAWRAEGPQDKWTSQSMYWGGWSCWPGRGAVPPSTEPSRIWRGVLARARAAARGLFMLAVCSTEAGQGAEGGGQTRVCGRQTHHLY